MQGGSLGGGTMGPVQSSSLWQQPGWMGTSMGNMMSSPQVTQGLQGAQGMMGSPMGAPQQQQSPTYNGPPPPGAGTGNLGGRGAEANAQFPWLQMAPVIRGMAHRGLKS